MVIIGILNLGAVPLVKHIFNQLGELKEKQEDHSRELHEHKLHVAENYVTKEQIKLDFERIEKSLDEIKDLVKGK